MQLRNLLFYNGLQAKNIAALECGESSSLFPAQALESCHPAAPVSGGPQFSWG